MDFQNILNNALLDLKKKINEIIREIEIILIKLEILYDYLNVKKEIPINFSVYENTENDVYQWGDIVRFFSGRIYMWRCQSAASEIAV